MSAGHEPLNLDELQQWQGRVQITEDHISAGPLAGLAALLDHDAPWADAELPPLAHWLYFLERERQSLLDSDGHPRRGGFLPPVPLPRRMWAAGRVNFLSPVARGAAVTRRSTITAVTPKTGRHGLMVFVTVRHEITVGGSPAIVEEQDIVYRSPPARGTSQPGPATSIASGTAPPAPGTSPANAPPRASERTRTITPDPVQLFRFSALTFNAHRIHYDRDYARDVEGYPGLVVHGPWVAMLLMDHWRSERTGRQLRAFSFRASQPLFDTAPFDLCLSHTAEGAELWANCRGSIAFTATVLADPAGDRAAMVDNT